MNHSRVVLLAVAVSSLGLAGCGTVTNRLGLTSPAPDEFRVITKAPLVIPPEYALRPPSPGQPSPQSLLPQQEAQAIMTGQRAAASRSQGETLLVQRAGGDRADATIRYVIDDENGNLAHKDKSFADLVMGWRPGQPRVVSTGANSSTPVNSASEEARLRQLTGGRTVIISRQRGVSLKLPGL